MYKELEISAARCIIAAEQELVQRLPVRIDVMNYEPDKLPLFVGLSVTPTVDLRTAPTGPNAGKFLQEPSQPGASFTP